MLDRLRYVVAMTMLLGVTLPCVAQNPPAPQTIEPKRIDPKACSDDQRLRGGGTAPQPSDRGSQNLSEKLERTDGIICPPDTDPGIRAPTPDTGDTPAIPPPGSPGGDPTVRPQ